MLRRATAAAAAAVGAARVIGPRSAPLAVGPRGVMASHGPPAASVLSSSTTAVAQRTVSTHQPVLRGVFNVSSRDKWVEVGKSRVPVLLLFHTTKDPAISAYASLIAGKVDELNSAAAHRATSSDGTAAGESTVVLKLGLVDVDVERDLPKQFEFAKVPSLYFMWNGGLCDKFEGIGGEAQIVDAIASFMQWVHEGATGNDGGEKPKRVDEDEENVLTLLMVALRKTQEKDFAKAAELFTKCRNMADEEVQKLKEKMGVSGKKMTPVTQERLKKDPNYNALPQAICGLAMVAMGQRKFEEAFEICQLIRRDYAWAIRDLRQVGDTMARVEMISISGYDVDHDSYVTLLKRDDLVTDPVDFYKNNVKLAVAHYYERHPEMAIEELLKLIRAEAKLMPALKKSGVTDGLNAKGASPQNATPARRVLFLVFEALGNNHPAVVDGRRKMAAFLYI